MDLAAACVRARTNCQKRRPWWLNTIKSCGAFTASALYTVEGRIGDPRVARQSERAHASRNETHRHVSRIDWLHWETGQVGDIVDSKIDW